MDLRDSRQKESSCEWRPLTCLLAVVLAIHLLCAYLSRDGVIQDDAQSYVRLGHNVAAGFGYVFEDGQHPTSWRAPGYPLFLAGVFWLTGYSPEIARFSQAFLWVGSSLLTYLLARRLLASSLAALLAAGCVGLYPEFVGLTGLLWSENLCVFLYLAALNVLLVISNGKRLSPAIGAGIVVGLTVLTRSTTIILLPAALFVAVSERRRPGALLRGAVVIGVAVLVIGAWTVRNYGLHGKFILVESNVGFNLYVGNSPTTPVPFAWQKLKHMDDDEDYQSLIRGRTEGESNAALSRAALTYIIADPVRSILRGFGKLFDFWLPDFFIAMNLRSGSYGAAYQFLWKPCLGLTVFVYCLVCIAAIKGALRSRHEWYVQYLGLVILLYTLPHGLVYGFSRYHLPLMPLLIILAAPEFLRWIDWFRGKANQREETSKDPAPAEAPQASAPAIDL